VVEIARFIDIVKAQTLGFFVFRSPYAILRGRGCIINLMQPLLHYLLIFIANILLIENYLI